MNWVKRLGPGLLYAGAAVGVSHIVQSTSAGATYGWVMLLAVLLANVLKYPFFEYGPRYANSTGESLIDGYNRLGKWAVVVFILLTVATMFIIEAAVTVVTSGLAINVFGLENSGLQPWSMSAILLIICVVLISTGGYKLLDKLMKWVMLILTISTIVALIFAFGASINKPVEGLQFIWSEQDFLFLVPFIGWMPAPLDISVWHSVWTVSKQKITGEKERNLFDFKVGYWGTMILAFFFVGLGALMIYGTGKAMPAGAVPFANELINIYKNALGDWAGPIIGVAALTTMFSTTITCLDAFPRALAPAFNHLSNTIDFERKSYRTFLLILTATGAVLVLKFFASSMKQLITFITVVSFLASPIIASLNMLVIKKFAPESAQPSMLNKGISYVGLVMLIGLSIYYLTLL